MDFFTWIILFVVAAVIIVVVQAIHTSDKKKGMEKALATLSDFSVSQKVMGDDGDSGIAVDEVRKKICLIKQLSPEDILALVTQKKQNEEDIHSDVLSISLDILSYGDILSSEIFEDGVTITKTSRGSQVGGAIIGGLALGGTGAIIGGLSAKKESSDKINRIDLRITVNRTKNPIHDIAFMNVVSEKHGILYKNAMEQARHWHSLLEVLMKRADSEKIAEEELDEKGTKLISNISIAGELEKLAELQKQGLLTKEEFKTQKRKLLA